MKITELAALYLSRFEPARVRCGEMTADHAAELAGKVNREAVVYGKLECAPETLLIGGFELYKRYADVILYRKPRSWNLFGLRGEWRYIVDAQGRPPFEPIDFDAIPDP